MSRISAKLREKIIQTAENRCGYCRTPQDLVPIPFEIEHITPKAAGGTDDEENLWLSCGVCNSFKHAKTHAVDPQNNGKFIFSILESKVGTSILNSVSIKVQLSAKPLAVGQPLSP